MQKFLAAAALVASVLTSACTPTSSQAPSAAPAPKATFTIATPVGTTATYSVANLCSWGYVIVSGQEFKLWRDGTYLTVGGVTQSLPCGAVPSGGGGNGPSGPAPGNPKVEVNPNEVEVPAVTPDGPPGLGTPDVSEPVPDRA